MPNNSTRLLWPLCGAQTNANAQLHMGEKQSYFFAYWTKVSAKQHLNKCWQFGSTQTPNWNQLMAKLQLKRKLSATMVTVELQAYTRMHFHTWIVSPPFLGTSHKHLTDAHTRRKQVGLQSVLTEKVSRQSTEIWQAHKKKMHRRGLATLVSASTTYSLLLKEMAKSLKLVRWEQKRKMGLFGSNAKQEPEGYMKNEEWVFDGFGGLIKT